MINLNPEVAARVLHNEAFFAVRAEAGEMVLCGGKEIIRVPGEGIKLGSKFFNIRGVLVKDDKVADYESRYQHVKTAGFSTNSNIVSYDQLKKRRNKRK